MNKNLVSFIPPVYQHIRTIVPNKVWQAIGPSATSPNVIIKNCTIHEIQGMEKFFESGIGLPLQTVISITNIGKVDFLYDINFLVRKKTRGGDMHDLFHKMKHRSDFDTCWRSVIDEIKKISEVSSNKEFSLGDIHPGNYVYDFDDSKNYAIFNSESFCPRKDLKIYRIDAEEWSDSPRNILLDYDTIERHFNPDAKRTKIGVIFK